MAERVQLGGMAGAVAAAGVAAISAALTGGAVPAAVAVAGVKSAVEKGLPRVQAWLADRQEQRAFAKEIEDWAQRQDVGQADCDLGLRKARDILEQKGARLEEIVRWGLDPERTTAEVLARDRAAFQSLPSSEARDVCRTAIEVFYRRTLRQLAADPLVTAALKELLASTGRVEASNQELAALVTQLLDMVEQLHEQAEPALTPPAYWATLCDVYRQGHVEDPRGREQEVEQLRAFVHGPPGFWWYRGDRFAGKTFLMTALAQQAIPAETAAGPALLGDDVDAVAYLISRKRNDNNGRRFLSVMVDQLSHLLGQAPPPAAVQGTAATAELADWFHQRWGQASHTAADRGRHLVLLVDALDEDLPVDEHTAWIVDLLPTDLHHTGHVLLTSKLRYRRPATADATHPLWSVTRTTLSTSPYAAKQKQMALAEITGLLNPASPNLGRNTAILGTMAAARFELTVDDVTEITGLPRPGVDSFFTRDATVTFDASPSLDDAYLFSHDLLLQACLTTGPDPDLGAAGLGRRLELRQHRRDIHAWAQTWRERGWPVAEDEPTPLYLVRHYPALIADDPARARALLTDPGWLNAAIHLIGPAPTHAALTAAQTRDPGIGVAARAVAVEAPSLRQPPPGDPGYVLRRLCLQALKTRADTLADSLRRRLLELPDAGLAPVWTTQRTGLFVSEVGSHDGPVGAVAVLPDGRIVTGGDDSRVRMWDPQPGATPVELGSHDGPVRAVAVLPDGRIVTGGDDDRVRIWDPQPDATPVELGSHDGLVQAVAVLPDGRIVTGGDDNRVRIWDPAARPPRSSSAATTAWCGRWRCCPTGASSPAAPTTGCGSGTPHPAPPRSSSAATTAWCGRWRCCPTGASSPAATTTGCGCGTPTARRHPGRARHPRRPGGGGGGAARRAHRHRRLGQPGADLGPPARRAPRSSSAPTTAGGAVAVLPDGRIVTGGWDNRVRIWDPTSPAHPGRARQPRRPGAGGGGAARRAHRHRRRRQPGADLGPRPARHTPVELGSHDGPVKAVAVLPDGRIVTGGGRPPVRLWDPDRPGHPRRARHPRRPGGGGGGAARRAHRHRRRRQAGCGSGTPTGPAPRSRSAPTTARCGRWRCCPTGASSPATPTTGCGSGTPSPTPPPAPASPAQSWHSPPPPVPTSQPETVSLSDTLTGSALGTSHTQPGTPGTDLFHANIQSRSPSQHAARLARLAIGTCERCHTRRCDTPRSVRPRP